MSKGQAIIVIKKKYGYEAFFYLNPKDSVCCRSKAEAVGDLILQYGEKVGIPVSSH